MMAAFRSALSCAACRLQTCYRSLNVTDSWCIGSIWSYNDNLSSGMIGNVFMHEEGVTLSKVGK